MYGDHGSAPLPERARSSSWGGRDARAELRRLAEDAGLRAGFSVSEIEVLRGDGLVELVAYAGPPAQEADMGKPFSLSLVRRVLQAGTRYGQFVFLAEEEMDAALKDAVRGYGYVPVVPDSSAPDRWRALDMLVAPLTDRSGRTRAVLHLDEPLSGRRPGPEELWEIVRQPRAGAPVGDGHDRPRGTDSAGPARRDGSRGCARGVPATGWS